MQNRTITRRLNSTKNELDETFKTIFSKSEIKEIISELHQIQKERKLSRRPSVLARLFHIFDVCEIKYERGKDDAYYEALARQIPAYTNVDIQNMILSELYNRYEVYPSPEDYMKRIVNHMNHQEWQNDTLRLRILKQFIKYGDYLKGANYGGQLEIKKYVKQKIKKAPSINDVLDNLDDNLFKCLDGADKKQLRAIGKYGLIKTADDLANGNFKASGATKRDLYLFAMVYGMTYYSNNQKEIQNYASDIEKNLFQDYYTNNLMRFMSVDDLREKGETDPSGQGINYKNFSEMIYIYFISKDLTPVEKIEKSTQMIERLQEKATSSTLKEDMTTRQFKNLYTEDILQLDEQRFEDFIFNHYECWTGTGDFYELRGETRERKIGTMEVSTSQNSAFLVYEEIVSKIKAFNINPRDFINGLNFIDTTNTVENLTKKEMDFHKLLKNMDAYLRNSEALLTINRPELMTRTILVATYYYLFITECEEKNKVPSFNFASLFEMFKNNIDPLLERAGYQLFSGKSIFDLLIVFSIYGTFNI